MKYIFLIFILFLNISFGNNEIENSEELLKKVLKELQLTEDDYNKGLYVEKSYHMIKNLQLW